MSLSSSARKELERRSTIGQIEAAFRNVLLEGGVTLHEAEVIDDYGSEVDRRAAREKDPEIRWQEVPDEKIERLQGISFLDERGFRFYIPAYMTWTLKNLEKSHSNSVDWTIHSLNDYRRAAQVFNEEQSKAILRFLRFIVRFGGCHSDSTAAQQAIKRYWGKFDPARAEGPA